ncbi:serine/threonine-protein phosphatase [Streptomyces sp. PTM05]|uniref:Serine/threonine-protein phosphatase n=1 Tax=Streptantibioticus parmotrematis TaxID=2873249 RepID=A0ABS7QJV9_9ACTN|nr:serine/threonine-protein phosphatase [Streptantibioticus parmotrematis]
MLLVDYGLTVLQPVAEEPRPEDAVPVDQGPVARAFAAQEAVVDSGEHGVTVHLPMSVRGDRIGVLRVRLPAGTPYEHDTAPLLDFADLLAHEIVAAGRHTDLYLRSRRRRRLTLAAEMQWQLLPGLGCSRDAYTIGGHLEPSYAIGGDNFDWSTSEHRLLVAVTDGEGQGIDATLLTSLTVGALRNARRAGLSLGDQARLADQAVHAQYGGKRHASTILLEFDVPNGTVRAVDAGSPRVLRQRGGRIDPVALEPQLPLGMFEETPYEEQTFEVLPGDRLIIVSSGVHTARSRAGDPFGDRALQRAVADSRLAPPYETARAVVRGLVDHLGSPELTADAAVLVIDWHGPDGEA